jgi:6-phosphofructokinase 1
MRRIGILTAGGDTPALNATIFGAVEQANQLGIEVCGIVKGFGGMMNDRVPHVILNPLLSTIPELDPRAGGTILGASRTYIDPSRSDELKQVMGRLGRLGLDGLICIGGDGTINGMQPLTEFFPCVLAPKTIDNDLGLNYPDECNAWFRDENHPCQDGYRYDCLRDQIELDEIVNIATPGYATAVFVVAGSIHRIRTTAESHRRVAIIEVMGRHSGYIALGSAYGQPDMILVPEVPVNFEKLERRVRDLYDLQQHVVIVVGEGVEDEEGHMLGAESRTFDPSGNVRLSGAAEAIKAVLVERLGDHFFVGAGGDDAKAASAIFTRKVGHTQRGGRPIRFDRFHAAMLGGKAVELVVGGRNNEVATLQWSEPRGFFVDSINANKLRDRWNMIHARRLHPSFYDAARFQPSGRGREFLRTIFTECLGSDDVEHILATQFRPSNLSGRYQSVNIDVQKRLRYLE